MTTNKTNYFDWNRIVQSWQFVFAALSAIIYVVGYTNAVLFLYALEIHVAPTEIYSVGSLFVWGLTFFIGSLVVPIFVYLLISFLKKYDAFSNKKRSLFLSILLALLCFFFLPVVGKYNPLGFQIFPDNLDYLVTTGDLILATIALIIIGYISFRLLKLQTNSYQLVLVFLILVIWNIVLLRGTWRHAFWIGIGAPPGLFAQSPAIQGGLITKGRIAGPGSEAPEFGNGAFVTAGLLLNRKDGAYYFYPGTGHAQEHLEGKYEWLSLVIVPESQVIAFIAD